MADPTRPDSLALQGYQSLAQGDADAALDAIGAALTALGEERPALRARLWGWRCQARLQKRQPQQAIRAIRHGLRAAREAGDADGLAALRDLQAQAMAQSAALKVPPPEDESPISLAVKALDDGKEQLGEILALGALSYARKLEDPREIVLAHLALARLPHRREKAIADARVVADEAGDMNLVTAVARAAQAAGIAIAPKVF